MMPGERNHFEKADQAAAFEEELREHHVVIEEARHFDIPPINYEIFGEMSREIQIYVQNLENWLSLPYVTDSFENHNERRKWRSAMQEKYGANALQGSSLFNLFHKNKLSGNSLSMASYMGIITMTLEEKPLFARLTKNIQSLGINALIENYPHSASNQVRREKIQEIEEAVVKGLDILSEFSQQNQLGYAA